MIGKLHKAKSEGNDRHQKLLSFLRGRGQAGATTREIARACDDCGVTATVAELRANQYQITCEYERSTDGGRKVYRYRLLDTGELFPVSQIEIDPNYR